MAKRYWVVGDTGADLGENEEGYTKRRAIEEAEAWSEATDGPIEIVPVRASYRARQHLRRLRRASWGPEGVQAFEDAY